MHASEDTLAFANRAMRYVVTHTDVGMMQNTFCDTFDRVQIEDFEPEKYFEIFEKDSGTATCGLAGQLMVKLLLENGIDAYTYNFGYKNTRLSHIIVLVKHQNRLLIYDPFMNYALQDCQGQHLSLEALLTAIGNNTDCVRYASDTLRSEMLIDMKAVPHMYHELLASKNCKTELSELRLVQDSIFKTTFNRCYSCERNRLCTSFIRDFETKLSSTTQLQQFHEGFALKINKIYGASDHVQVNARIDSLIARSVGIQERIKL